MSFNCSSVLVLSLLAAVSPLAWGQNLNPSADNGKLDPDTSVALPGCTLVAYQNGSEYGVVPMAGMCGDPTGNITTAEIEAMGVKYAPVVFFHPLDSFTMTDPASIFTDPSAGKFVKDGEVIQDTLDFTTLGTYISDPDVWIQMEQTDEYLAGDGFAADGSSNAPAYWNYVDLGNNIWQFNYYYFFPYSGWTAMLLTSQQSGNIPYYPFEARPFGEHEGDWESVSVMVCASSSDTSQPIAATYFHEGYVFTTDCTQGECTFYKDTDQIVAFAALNHHGMSPTLSRSNFLLSYSMADVGLNAAIHLRDVTGYEDSDGKVYHYMATADNLKLVNASDPMFEYAGAWGKAVKDTRVSPELPLLCMDADQLEYVECEPNLLVTTILGLVDSLGQDAEDFLPAEFANLILYAQPGNPGPTQLAQFYEWRYPEPSIMWYANPDNTISEEDFCADKEYVVEAATSPVVPEDSSTGSSTNDATTGSSSANLTSLTSLSAIFSLAFMWILMA